MNEETKRLIDEVQGIIDDAAAEEKALPSVQGFAGISERP